MNHTIKGILIVAAIASMLVLGASMVPIMQNSFASKKSDFKKERDTNTNTNTNTADSSSSSTATADNTNNIDNTATASQSQEQSACAVAVTCQEGSTTVTPPPTSTCNPSTIGGVTAIRSDGACLAALPLPAPDAQLAAFERDCESLPDGVAFVRFDTVAICTFPSTPPT